MKKKITKPLVLVLCAGLITASVSAAVYAANTGKKEDNGTSEAGNISEFVEEAEVTKDETVYVLSGADGSVQKIIVSDWIKNSMESESIADKSELSDVENVKGDETYTMDGDNIRVWDAQGSDIYYQGDIEKELPVDLSVSYTLDGEPVSPSELAGKSGRVTIRFEYGNKQYEMAEIDGKQEKIYVPFAMMTGMMLDNDNFTNVEVTNGKLVNDGSRTVVAGIAFPGLQSNLNLDAGKMEIPDYVEISADVKGFEMTNTVTVASNDIFSDLSAEEIDSVDDLSEALDELTDAMEQLMDGSSELYDGLCTLQEKSEGLTSGISQLADGAAELENGAGEIDAGTGELAAGAQELANGLDTLAANSDTLNAGSRQVFESLLSMTDQQLAAAGITAPKLTISNYAEVLDNIIASVNSDGTAEEQEQAVSAAAAISEMKEQLDSYHAFYIGLNDYTEGVASAKSGADELYAGADRLKSGTAELYAGMEALCDGSVTLKNGVPALSDGVTQLCDGAMQLSDGLKEFNEEGVEKLVDAVEGDLGGLIARVKATVDVSRDYKSFSGLSDTMDGQVKFVYRTDAIEAE